MLSPSATSHVEHCWISNPQVRIPNPKSLLGRNLLRVRSARQRATTASYAEFVAGSRFLYDLNPPSPTPRSRAPPKALFSPSLRSLMFSPLLNSSHRSVAGVGSSFHSWEEPKIGSLQRLYDYESQRAGNQSASASGTSVDSDPTLVGSDDKAEEIYLKHTGLTKVDIAATQASVVDIACSKPRRGSSQAETAAEKDFTSQMKIC